MTQKPELGPVEEPVIFLDVDGVLISRRSFLVSDGARPGFDPLAVGIVNRIVKRVNARVIFNTTWNLMPLDLSELIRASNLNLGQHGMHFTSYPIRSDDRLQAIEKWLEGKEERPWVALDDAEIDSPKAVLVNPDVGLDYSTYVKATRILGSPDVPVIFL